MQLYKLLKAKKYNTKGKTLQDINNRYYLDQLIEGMEIIVKCDRNIIRDYLAGLYNKNLNPINKILWSDFLFYLNVETNKKTCKKHF